jgi:hypothetical protein
MILSSFYVDAFRTRSPSSSVSRYANTSKPTVPTGKSPFHPMHHPLHIPRCPMRRVAWRPVRLALPAACGAPPSPTRCFPRRGFGIPKATREPPGAARQRRGALFPAPVSRRSKAAGRRVVRERTIGSTDPASGGDLDVRWVGHGLPRQ